VPKTIISDAQVRRLAESLFYEYEARERGIRAAIERGDIVPVTLPGGERMYAHAEDRCTPPCPIHSPSEHSMRGFPLHWRGDRGIMERICPHGVGHPDPDTLAYIDPDGSKMEGVHGCDGCCAEREPQEP